MGSFMDKRRHSKMAFVTYNIIIFLQKSILLDAFFVVINNFKTQPQFN
jgi:hypothetical protein